MTPFYRQPVVSETIAVALAWLVPGAGHIFLGRKLRGILILVTIAATFWSGIAIGGVMTIDVRTERLWFAAGMLTGVHGLIGYERSEAENGRIDDELMKDPEFARNFTGLRMQLVGAPKEKAAAVLAEMEQYRNQYAGEILARDGHALVSPQDTVARAYCGIAGLLNLMCIFDAFMLARIGYRNEGREQGETQEPRT